MILAVYTTLILTGHLLAVQWSNMIVNVTNVFTFLNIYHVFIFKIVVKTNMNMKIPARNTIKGCLSNDYFIDFDLLRNPYCKIYFT